jgi:hypothetical protein
VAAFIGPVSGNPTYRSRVRRQTRQSASSALLVRLTALRRVRLACHTVVIPLAL